MRRIVTHLAALCVAVVVLYASTADAGKLSCEGPVRFQQVSGDRTFIVSVPCLGMQPFIDYEFTDPHPNVCLTPIVGQYIVGPYRVDVNWPGSSDRPTWTLTGPMPTR